MMMKRRVLISGLCLVLLVLVGFLWTDINKNNTYDDNGVCIIGDEECH